MTDADDESLRQAAWDGAFRAFGTARIFERRYARARRLRAIVDVVVLALGEIVVLLVGWRMSLSGEWLITLCVGMLGVVGLFDKAVLGFGLRLHETQSQSLERAKANYALADDFRALGATPPAARGALRRELELLQARSEQIKATDIDHAITDAERRFGMRAALREFRRSCANCEKVPADLEPTDCPVCGQF